MRQPPLPVPSHPVTPRRGCKSLSGLCRCEPSQAKPSCRQLEKTLPLYRVTIAIQCESCFKARRLDSGTMGDIAPLPLVFLRLEPLPPPSRLSPPWPNTLLPFYPFVTPTPFYPIHRRAVVFTCFVHITFNSQLLGSSDLVATGSTSPPSR